MQSPQSDQRRALDRQRVLSRLQARRSARQRHLQAETFVRQHRQSRPQAVKDVPKATPQAPPLRNFPIHPFVILLGLFALIGVFFTVFALASLSPDTAKHQLIFVLSSGFLIWGIVGLVIWIFHHNKPQRLHPAIAYDALRQGLLAAGFLELNLVSRLMHLWSPAMGIIIFLIFALFEALVLIRANHA
ncbi:MAG: hypothetical protein M1296_04615 [Chloroflexi bacterium]|nr:hypothetical protein [Chloroflexota bacterium]